MKKILNIVEGNEVIVNKAYRRAKEYEQQFTGCCQTTIAGICDALNIKSEDLFRAGSGLADGLGLTRNGTCGALVGGCMVIGYLFGRPRKDFPDMLKPMKSYLLCKKLHDSFSRIYPSIRCRDIQESVMGQTFNLLDKNEAKQAITFGMFEYCSKIVGTVANLTCLIILEERCNY
jgi:C_GCAxxG_C_C family probable redox protein